MVNPEIVGALRAALQFATPAPWGQIKDGDRAIYALDGDAWPVDSGDDGGCANPADAALIVLLRNHAADLLSELEDAERRGAVKAFTSRAQKERDPVRAAWLVGQADRIENGETL